MKLFLLKACVCLLWKGPDAKPSGGSTTRAPEKMKFTVTENLSSEQTGPGRATVSGVV